MTRLPLAASLLLCVLIALCSGLLSHCSKTPAAGHDAYKHTEAIVAFGPRPPGSEALNKTRDYISTTLAKDGWVTQAREFTSFTPKGQMTFVNLVARYAPKGDSPTLWTRPVKGLLAAHIDSKFFTDRRFLGADDAASAVGAILELATDLSKSPAQAKQLELVFFDGEEAYGAHLNPRDGLYGSRNYASAWRRQETKPAFGLLLDMVGHQNLSISIPSDSPEHLAEALFQAADAEGERGSFAQGNIPILDDHVPLNNVGIPTLDIIGDFSSTNWWHNSRDNMDLISPDSLDISVRVVRSLLQELLP